MCPNYRLLLWHCKTNWAQIFVLWSSVVSYDPNGRFQIRLYWLFNLRIWILLGVLVCCAEGRGRVEERECSRCANVVNSTIVCSVLIYIGDEMASHSPNTAHIQIYSLKYSTVYSVQYMQYNTATYFSNSTIIGVWTVPFTLWHRAEWCIFNNLLLPSSGYYWPRIETLCVIILKATVQIIIAVQSQYSM